MATKVKVLQPLWSIKLQRDIEPGEEYDVSHVSEAEINHFAKNGVWEKLPDAPVADTAEPEATKTGAKK